MQPKYNAEPTHSLIINSELATHRLVSRAADHNLLGSRNFLIAFYNYLFIEIAPGHVLVSL